MIYIKFERGQGLGNQLWNYAVLRSIASYRSLDYKVLNFENFKGKEFIEIEETSNYKIKTKSDNKEIFYEELFYDKNLETISSDYDQSIMEIKDNVLLKGIFQSEEYLIPNKNIINNFIKIKTNIKVQIDLDKTCIINLRGGEYKRHKNLILPKSYWINAMNNIKKINSNLNFKIVTDDEKYAENFLPGIEIIRGNTESDFYNIYKAKYLIVSNSSFSYFPINLGNTPEIVIAPLYWARFGNKFNRWSSPSNYYKDWSWQDDSGKILNNKKVFKTLIDTRKEFKKYKVRFRYENLESNYKNSYLFTKIKKFIKFLLSILFPLKYG